MSRPILCQGILVMKDGANTQPSYLSVSRLAPLLIEGFVYLCALANLITQGYLIFHPADNKNTPIVPGRWLV